MRMKVFSVNDKKTRTALSVLVFLVLAMTALGYGLRYKAEDVVALSEKAGLVIHDDGLGETKLPKKEVENKVRHLPTPEKTKVGYMTSWVAGTSSIRDPLVSFFEESEFNSIIIDIKDDTGKISYRGSNPEIEALGSYENRIPNIKELIEDLHKKDMYVIGRIAVFQDPHMTGIWKDQAVQTLSGSVWEDRKGLSWMDASSEKVWDYVIDIAKESYDLGFDEINFDYVRFPTDGSAEMVFPLSGEREMSEVIGEFFAYVDQELDKGEYEDMVRSVDLFGLVTSAADDLGIGQILEKAVEHFDYVAPMTYPSHYGAGFAGLQNPNSAPGVVIARAMEDGKNKLANFVDEEVVAYSKQFTQIISETDPETGIVSTREEIKSKDQKKISAKRKELEKMYDFQKIRPWLQDFDYGGDYGYVEVRAQIDAVYASGLDSWMMWDPSNKYTKSAY
jgi:hypothetical protein